MQEFSLVRKSHLHNTNDGRISDSNSKMLCSSSDEMPEIPTGTGDQLDLLCLPTPVVSLILQHLKGPDDGEQGRMQTILNLREVCNTTRRWIDDDLGENEGRKLFSNSQIHVDLSEGPEGTLERFLQCPPPRHITYLRLSGASKAREAPETFRQFTQSWTTDIDDDFNKGRHFIDSLELDTYDTNCTALIEFLRSPNLAALRKLRYGKIAGWPSTAVSVGGGMLPNFFSHLQDFQLDSSADRHYLGTSSYNVEDFCRNVAQSSTLKKVSLLHEKNFRTLLLLIQRKREDPNLQLEIALNMSLKQKLFLSTSKLFRAIGESRSTFRIAEIDEHTFYDYINDNGFLSDEKLTEFREGVQAFHVLSFDCEHSASLLESEVNFPNLKRIVVPKLHDHYCFGSHIGLTLDDVSCRLKHTNVSCLTLNHLQCPDTNLVKILTSFSTGLPNLSTLEVKWNPYMNAPFLIELSGHEESKFHKLTSLDFTVDLDDTKNSAKELAVALQGVLLRGLGLFQRPLRKLAVRITPISNPVAQECFERLFEEENFLDQLCKSKMCQTLAEFDVSHEVNGNQKVLWEKLKESVKENYAKRARTHGFVRGQLA